jgi:hypothetical protein
LGTKKIFSVMAIVLLATLLVVSFASIPKVKATGFNYHFYGPIDENTGVALKYKNGSPAYVNVTVHYLNSPPDTFSTNGNGGAGYSFNTTTVPIYFAYDITDNTTGLSITSHREYWLKSDFTETSGTYILWGATSGLTTYTIAFLDYVGQLKSYPIIKAQIEDTTYTVMNYTTVDDRPVDAQNTVIMNLQEGHRYRIVLSDGVNDANDIVYGFLTPSSTTGIQLVLRGVDFPKQTLLLYQYVHAYAVRDFLNPVGSITVSYGDTTSMTNSVTITITNASDSTVAFMQVFSGVGYQTFSYTWAYADNATNYEVTVAIDHLTFGSFSYKQYLIGEYTTPTAPFSLDFLGTLSISTAWMIPALLIIFVAGCFSELSAEVGGVLTTIVAIILAAMGWIPITSAALVTALALSIMAGIVTARRRMLYS